MAKMWQGRTDGLTDKFADDFNSSISIDKRMYRQDILGSIAHTKMLAACNIINSEDEKSICAALKEILQEIENGSLIIDETCEDIHMFVEEVLTNRIGEAGKKLHTARSRNDQVALDIRMYLKDEVEIIKSLIKKLIVIITEKSDEYSDAIMPGYTHLQRAQPITFGHHLLTYAFMLDRDFSRLNDCYKRMNVSPIGSCALAGTTYNTDRKLEADLLGFDDVCLNSIDGVSDRDFALELLSDLSIIMMHLSRFSEEIILWCSWEFKFIELADEFTTGSSIMPQKKNPDMAELVRGKTGRVYGNLISLLTTLKGIPLAYNKDMQEDKECIFDAIDTVKNCLNIFCGMLKSIKANKQNMLGAAKKGFINATDLADYLVNKGLPFRSAYKISGQIVKHCIEKDKTLEELDIKTYKTYSDLFDEDLYNAIDLTTCVNKRLSFGGTSFESVKNQIEFLKTKYK